VGFLERLRDYLERVGRAPQGLPAIHVDVAAHRRHFAEASGQVKAQLQTAPAEEAEAMRESLPTFLEEVADQIQEIVAPNASREEVTKLINAAINWELRGDDESTIGSRGLDEEIRRVAESARARLKWRRHRDGWESPARYAFEIRAISRNHPDRHTLTRSGAALLELPGIDAVRWLLALESAQSLGPLDEWRLSSELAARLVKEPERDIDVEELVDGSWRFSLPTIRRLEAMQLLHYEGQELNPGRPNFSYAVFKRALPLLEEIAERRPTPFAVLADALLRDEAAHALDHARPGVERALHDSAAASTALQARMVVHEIRNALIPAQIAFSRVDREIAETQPGLLQDHRNRVDAGIQRALTFAEEMLRVANLGMEPAAPFDAAAAIRDAIAGVAGDLNDSFRYTPPDDPLLMIGSRAHFVLAITNLLRNAAQAVTGRESIVEISIEEHEDGIVVRVDDNGPGVPIEHRDAIFKPGVTLRPGGSGQGLALVWQVVVGEMRGSVACGDSPIGGARFEIVIAAKGEKGT
jgi:signal transduction histidine kinase